VLVPSINTNPSTPAKRFSSVPPEKSHRWFDAQRGMAQSFCKAIWGMSVRVII
jgi:hypothetical protein